MVVVSVARHDTTAVEDGGDGVELGMRGCRDVATPIIGYRKRSRGGRVAIKKESR
jgi:hypothetical protein